MTFSLNSSESPFVDPQLFSRSSESAINSQDLIFRHIQPASNIVQYQKNLYRSSKNSQVKVYQQKLKTQKQTDFNGQIKDKISNIKSNQENKKQSQNQQALKQNKLQLRKGYQLPKQKKLIELKKQLKKVCRKKYYQDILYHYNDQAKFKNNNFKKSMGKLFIKRLSEKIEEEGVKPTDPEWIQRMRKLKKKYTRKENKCRSYNNKVMSQILCLDNKEYSRINLKIFSEVTRDYETIRDKVILSGHGRAFNTIKYLREIKELNLMCRSTTLIKKYFGMNR